MKEWQFFILLICFLAMTFFEAKVCWSIERDLLEATLGNNYYSTVAELTKKYGKPVESGKNSEGAWHSFNLTQGENPNKINIGTDEIITNHVAWILIHGNKAVEGLNFLGGVNLGESMDLVAIRLTFPPESFVRKNGDIVWIYPPSNFGFIFKNGVVSGIQIFSWNTIFDESESKPNMEVLSTLEANLKEKQSNFSVRKSDALKQYCKARHPLFYNKEHEVFLLRANLQIEGAIDAYQFLVDTGWSNTAITSQLCETLGCKILELEEEGMKKRFTSGGTLVIGGLPYDFDNFYIDDSNLLDSLGVDGVIGGDVLFATELILSLKGEYLCRPSKPLGEIARALPMNSIEAVYDAGRVWINFTADGTVVNDYFLDTGATGTSFLQKDIERLGLKFKGGALHKMAKGTVLSETFGPVTVEWPGFSLKLDEIIQLVESEFQTYRKLGNDFLSFLTIGFSQKSQRVYFTD